MGIGRALMDASVAVRAGGLYQLELEVVADNERAVVLPPRRVRGIRAQSPGGTGPRLRATKNSCT